MFTSNANELIRHLDDLVDTMGFDHSIANMSLGKRMAEKTAEMIASRSIQFQKGASQKWDKNKSPYKEWKEREYGVYDLAGVRTGQMLSHESLLGETTVEHDEITMVYGTDEPPVGGATRHITDADKKVTDRQKAKWFTEGNADQAERPFYELDQDIADEVFDIVVEAVEKMLRA